MRARVPVALAVLLVALLPAVAAPAFARGPASAAQAAQARHDAIVAFWTPERLRSAVSRDFSFQPTRGYVQAARPKAKPGGGGNVTGASWPNGLGKIYKASGKVFFVMAGTAYVCSGSVVNDSRSNFSIVLTAGHCAYDETANGSANGFATQWIFIPQFDSSPTFTCANTTYGCWTAQALVVHSGFATAGGFNTQATTYDWAFAVVGAGGLSNNAQLDSTVGSYPLAAQGFASGTRMDAFGYPAAGKYHGNDLTYCAGPVSFDSLNDNLTYGISCGMTGGSSGGPWLTGLNEATGDGGTLSSNVSYGYSGVKSLFGPKYNSNTSATLSAANTATSNRIV